MSKDNLFITPLLEGLIRATKGGRLTTQMLDLLVADPDALLRFPVLLDPRLDILKAWRQIETDPTCPQDIQMVGDIPIQHYMMRCNDEKPFDVHLCVREFPKGHKRIKQITNQDTTHLLFALGGHLSDLYKSGKKPHPSIRLDRRKNTTILCPGAEDKRRSQSHMILGIELNWFGSGPKLVRVDWRELQKSWKKGVQHFVDIGEPKGSEYTRKMPKEDSWVAQDRNHLASIMRAYSSGFVRIRLWDGRQVEGNSGTRSAVGAEEHRGSASDSMINTLLTHNKPFNVWVGSDDDVEEITWQIHDAIWVA